MTHTITLLPLDERPVNTRYPQMLGAIGGAEVRLPPPEIRGRQRLPADRDAVAEWLKLSSADSAAVLVSCEFLAFGNLISARISSETSADALARLDQLTRINNTCPVHAFSVITRVPDSDDCVEEPLYWCEWGQRLARYARLWHRQEQGVLTADDQHDLRALDNSIPQDVKADWLTRRLRNHIVNLALLEMMARHGLTSLLLTSDDTALYGFSSRERDWLQGWSQLLKMDSQNRVLMHPGADEVGSALVARSITRHHALVPRVWIEWAVPGDQELVAPYEDRPVRETVLGQLAACGCAVADTPEQCDFVLGVVTPSPRRTDYRPEYLDEDRVTRTPDYAQFLLQLARWQSAGIPVALGDVAYPNGSDPLLIELLLSTACPLRAAALCAYGGWNTAGNTLGVVVAQAVCSLQIGGNADRAAAQSRFLAHRLLEDWGYQSKIRREARAEAERLWGRRDPDPSQPAEVRVVCSFIEQRLKQELEALQQHGIGTRLTISPGSVYLPWGRTFEVDFELRDSAK